LFFIVLGQPRIFLAILLALFLGGFAEGAIAHTALTVKPTLTKQTPTAQVDGTAIEPASPDSDVISQASTTAEPDFSAPIDLDPAVVEESPLLQRWLEEIPDVQSEIRTDPSTRSRIRLGYVQFPSTDNGEGFNVGVEEVFLGRTGLTVSGEFQSTFEGDRQSYGADLRYYVLPLGNYVNVAPVVGYRHLETDEYTTDGVNVGLRLQLALSRTGAADVAVSQTWVNPGNASEEVGLTTISLGYALTQNLRISTDWQQQNAPQDKDRRFGIGLEWML
jgi:hypothetical protein